MQENTITPKVSEIFASFQGEANNAGVPSLWIRFFGCNLECQGFGQEFPLIEETWENETFDFSAVTKLGDLPIPLYGCDSSYSWAAKFRHLSPKLTIDAIVDKLLELGKERFNMNNSWKNSITRQDIQLCFTGGEPMMQQAAMVAIVNNLHARGSNVSFVTIETNGTKPLTKALSDCFWNKQILINWAISPKLASVSGERLAYRPDVFVDYFTRADSVAIKFVVTNSKECWDEIDALLPDLVKMIDQRVFVPITLWAMPEGATFEDQQGARIAEIANEAMKRGFYIATRNHIQVYGNAIGT